MHTSSLFALAAMLAVALPLNATTLAIQAWDGPGHKGRVTIRAGAAQCTLPFTGSGRTVTCTLAVAAGTPKLVLDRDYSIVEQGQRVTVKGLQEVRIVDAGQLFASLRDRRQPFGDRARKFVESKMRLERDPVFDENKAWVSLSDPQPRDHVAAAERRLGFALPREHVELLTTAGTLQIDDSSFDQASTLNSAWTQMLRVWETPENELKRLPPRIRELLRSSVILFTEVGDGYGAMLYRPVSADCNGGPGYYFTHQDEMAQPPALIRNADGKCADYTDAIVWLFSRFIVEPYEGGNGEIVVIDSGRPRLTTDLNLYPTQPPQFKFTAVWE